MFPDVATFLTLDQRNLDDVNVCILEEEDQLGSFLIHHFLCSALKNNSSVLFVGLEQSLGHYHAVAMKLGVNLLKAVEKKQLIFYEGLKKLTQNFFQEDHAMSLEEMFSDLRAEIDTHFKHSDTEKVFVIVDKVSLLLSYGFTLGSVATLCKRLMQMTCQSSSTSKPMACVMRFRIADSDDEDLKRLTSYIKSNCNLVTVVSPLISGSSKDVTGHIAVAWNPQGSSDQAQFRVEDKGVRVFAKGMSRAVL